MKIELKLLEFKCRIIWGKNKKYDGNEGMEKPVNQSACKDTWKLENCEAS